MGRRHAQAEKPANKFVRRGVVRAMRCNENADGEVKKEKGWDGCKKEGARACWGRDRSGGLRTG